VCSLWAAKRRVKAGRKRPVPQRRTPSVCPGLTPPLPPDGIPGGREGLTGTRSISNHPPSKVD
jgi:hypothetical protein